MTSFDRVIAHLLDAAQGDAHEDDLVPTSLLVLDDLLAGGLRTGQTTVIASRSGDGASTFALGLARSAAMHHHLPTAVLAPQAPETELVLRLVSAETQIPLQQMRSGRLSDEERRRLRDWRGRLMSGQLMIRAAGHCAGDLVTAVDGVTTEHDGTRLVVVDSIATLGRSAREAVIAMTALARERHFALVLVTGIHHAPRSQWHPPELTDLRDHDAVVDVVDNVLVLEEADPPESVVHVVKHRYGPTGSVRIAKIAHTCAYVNLP